MAATAAERPQAFRRRQAERVTTLEQENARRRADLVVALAEAERLAARQGRHPAAAVDSSQCRACDTDIG